MDIHIDCRWICLNEKEGDRILTLHQGGVIAFAKGAGNDGGFDGATIEKAELLTAITPPHAGRSDKPPHLDALVFVGFDLEQATGEVVSDEAADSFAQAGGCRELKGESVVSDQ